jgi:MYXO-CTERM domain-containing protein
MTRWRYIPGALAIAAALVTPATASADIGITRVSPNSVSPGQSVKVEIGCGWPKGCPQRIPVSVVPADKAPMPRPCDEIPPGKLPPATRFPANAVCSPITTGPPHHRPYRFLGRAARTKGSCGPWPASIVKCYELRVRTPHMSPGPYAFVAYIPYRHPRGTGSLLSGTRPKTALRVRPESNSVAQDSGGSLSIWPIAAAVATALVAGGFLRRRRAGVRHAQAP